VDAVNWGGVHGGHPGRVSHASLSVVMRECSAWEPLDELPPDAHLMVRSDRPLAAQPADLLALLDRRIGQLATRQSQPPSVTEASKEGALSR
jgi:hypothetical protein